MEILLAYLTVIVALFIMFIGVVIGFASMIAFAAIVGYLIWGIKE